MERRWPRAVRDKEPVWTLLAAVVVVAGIVLVWGIDWTGPDRTPPGSNTSVWGSDIPWDGGECLNLDRWSDDHWDRIAYSVYSDANKGEWGPPQTGEQFCQPVGITGRLNMADDLATGIYRVCGIGESGCYEFTYLPE